MAPEARRLDTAALYHQHIQTTLKFSFLFGLTSLHFSKNPPLFSLLFQASSLPQATWRSQSPALDQEPPHTSSATSPPSQKSVPRITAFSTAVHTLFVIAGGFCYFLKPITFCLNPLHPAGQSIYNDFWEGGRVFLEGFLYGGCWFCFVFLFFGHKLQVTKLTWGSVGKTKQREHSCQHVHSSSRGVLCKPVLQGQGLGPIHPTPHS